MKILLLNPNVDTKHQLVQSLRDQGHALLLASNAIEAWQILELHGASVELAVVHREGHGGQSEEGLEFVARFKTDPKHSDLPYILTTDQLSEDECADHQEDTFGANAYLVGQWSADQLIETISAVMGEPFKAPNTKDEAEVVVPPPPVKNPYQDVDELSIQLESPSEMLSATPPPPPSRASINSSGPSKSTSTHRTSLGSSSDRDHQLQMPYLFGDLPAIKGEIRPLGDAIVPGGASKSPDLETLKKYLTLREQDVAYLSKKLKASQVQIQQMGEDLKKQKSKTSEAVHQAREFQKQMQEIARESRIEKESLDKVIEDLEFKLRSKSDKAKVLAEKIKDAENEIEKIKERVRIDIQKIRVREKELENKLEVMKKDSEILIQNRENKIIELKRKLDLMEFNLDLLEDQCAKEKERNKVLEKRLAQASQAMRVAGGFLESEGEGPSDKQRSYSQVKAS